MTIFHNTFNRSTWQADSALYCHTGLRSLSAIMRKIWLNAWPDFPNNVFLLKGHCTSPPLPPQPINSQLYTPFLNLLFSRSHLYRIHSLVWCVVTSEFMPVLSDDSHRTLQRYWVLTTFATVCSRWKLLLLEQPSTYAFGVKIKLQQHQTQAHLMGKLHNIKSTSVIMVLNKMVYKHYLSGGRG